MNSLGTTESLGTLAILGLVGIAPKIVVSSLGQLQILKAQPTLATIDARHVAVGHRSLVELTMRSDQVVSTITRLQRMIGKVGLAVPSIHTKGLALGITLVNTRLFTVLANKHDTIIILGIGTVTIILFVAVNIL